MYVYIGCCWAFSAVAAVEGITKLKTGKLISLSEQELVDCDTSGEDQGCQGGLMDNAFDFILQNHGLSTESNYPYQGTDDTCSSSKSANHAAKITGHEDVPVNSESSLLKAVASQPISVAIDASGSDFQFYSSGVFTGECGTQLDHGVTAVGYGVSEDGTKYWLVKNSWGTGWGVGGYIMMERGVAAKEGLCGIAMAASYPTPKICRSCPAIPALDLLMITSFFLLESKPPMNWHKLHTNVPQSSTTLKSGSVSNNLMYWRIMAEISIPSFVFSITDDLVLS